MNDIDIKHCYFHSLVKNNDDVYLVFLSEDNSDSEDDDMEYLSLLYIKMKFTFVSDFSLSGRESDNYKYIKGDIDYQNKKVHLQYKGMNFESGEENYEFSFAYKDYQIVEKEKIESVDC